MADESSASSEAAALVLAERARARAAAGDAGCEVAAPAEEEVSAVGWVGAEAGDVDASELSRRQRAIGRRLADRQRQLLRDSREIERVREELAALEAPLKAEIMSLRTALEEANRREMGLVGEVNGLRRELHGKEKALVVVRAEKQQHTDSLISVMADYERRKTDALDGIAALVGEEPGSEADAPVKKPAGFLGF